MTLTHVVYFKSNNNIILHLIMFFFIFILERVASFQGCCVLHELCIICLWLANLHEEQCLVWMLQAFTRCQVIINYNMCLQLQLNSIRARLFSAQ